MRRLAAAVRSSAAAVARNPRGVAASAAFAAVVVGLWWERPSLALIVPGGFVLAALSWTHVRGGFAPPPADGDGEAG